MNTLKFYYKCCHQFVTDMLSGAYIAFSLLTSVGCSWNSSSRTSEYAVREDTTQSVWNATVWQTVQMTEMISTGNVSLENNKRNFVDYRKLAEYKAFYFLITYSTYITSIPGFVTNPLSVFFALKIRPKTTSEVHMLVLGITDFFLVFTRTTINAMRNFNYHWTDFSCKLLHYSVNSSYVFSNWVLLSWTIERFIAVMFPIKLSIWCTQRNVKIFLFLFLMSCALIMIPNITEINALPTNSGRVTCQASAFYFRNFAMIENVAYIYIPIIFVTLCDFTIIIKVKRASRKRTLYTSNQDKVKKLTREQRQMTIVLITVAFAFLFLHVPKVISKIWQALYPNQLQMFQDNVSNYTRFIFYTTLGYIIADFQNSVNFILYCISCSKVRKILYRPICCRKTETINSLIVEKTATTII